METLRRKRLTRRQVLEHWERSEGRCWRCEQKIINEVYGVGWQLGHCDKPHWMGGIEVAPEHTACNMADAVVQTKAAAKSVRIRVRAAGIKKEPTRSLSRKMNGDVCRWNPETRKYDILVWTRNSHER